MALQSSGFTYVGRRTTNQDALFMDPSQGLFVVADGMGGYAGGEIASKLAVDTITDFYQENRTDRDRTWPFSIDLRRSFCENLARSAIELAHRAVCRARTGDLKKMGSTVALLSLCKRRGVVAHVGDSRVYRLRAHQGHYGDLEQLTRDHSIFEEMKRINPERPLDEATFPYAHVITRALGIETEGGADVTRLSPRKGDVYLLCSDGLSGALDHAQIRALLLALGPEEAAQRIVESAFEAGSNDNITAVVARVA